MKCRLPRESPDADDESRDTYVGRRRPPNMTFKQIGVHLGVSTNWVKVVHSNAIVKLRRAIIRDQKLRQVVADVLDLDARLLDARLTADAGTAVTDGT